MMSKPTVYDHVRNFLENWDYHFEYLGNDANFDASWKVIHLFDGWQEISLEWGVCEAALRRYLIGYLGQRWQSVWDALERSGDAAKIFADHYERLQMATELYEDLYKGDSKVDRQMNPDDDLPF
jgi:hypothetical protein